MSKEILDSIIESHKKAEKFINTLDVWHRPLFRALKNQEIDLDTNFSFEHNKMSKEHLIQHQAIKVASTISNYDVYVFGLINSIEFKNKHKFRKFYIPLKVYELCKEYPCLGNWWNESVAEWKQYGLLFGRFDLENLYISNEIYKAFSFEKEYPNTSMSLNAWIEYCK